MPLLKLTSVRIPRCVPNDDGTYELVLDIDAAQLARAEIWRVYHVANTEPDNLGDAGPCVSYQSKCETQADSRLIDETIDFAESSANGDEIMRFRGDLADSADIGERVLLERFNQTQSRAMDDCAECVDTAVHPETVETRLRKGGWR